MKLCPLHLIDGEVAFTERGDAWLGLHIEPYSGEMLSDAERIRLASRLYKVLYSRVEEGLLVLLTHRTHTDAYVKTITDRAPVDPELRAAYADYALDVEQELIARPSFTSSRYLFIRLHEARPEDWKEAAAKVKAQVERAFGIKSADFTKERLAAVHAEAGEMRRHAQSSLTVRAFTTDDWHSYVSQQYRRGAQRRIADNDVPGVKSADGRLVPATARLAAAGNCIVAEDGRHVEIAHEDEVESVQSFMCLSRLPEGQYPMDGGGWLYRLLWMGLPVDAAIRFKRREAREFMADLRRKSARHADQIEQLNKAGHEVPNELRDARDEAKVVSEITKKTKAPGIEFSTTFAIYGAQLTEVREATKQLKSSYETDQYEIVKPLGEQARLFSGFFPGGQDVPVDYLKYAAPTYIAASEMHMNHEVGTSGGVYVGRVIWGPSSEPVKGYGSVVSLDGAEAAGRYSTATALVGTLGGGKTASLKACLLYPQLLRGARAIIFDPKDSEYSSLARLPGMDKRVAQIKPAKDSQISFDPLAVMSDPDAKESVAASFLQMLTNTKPESNAALYIDQAVEWAMQNGSRLVHTIDFLSKHKEHEARQIADHLTRYAKAPFSRLAFGADTIDITRQVTIFDLEAMSLPDRETLTGDGRLTREQHLSVCMFYLMNAYALEFARVNNPTQLATIVFDELHVVSAFSQGRELMNKVLRMGRSKNVQMFLSSQSAADFAGMTEHIPTRIAFRQESAEEDGELAATAKFVCGRKDPEVMQTIGALGTGQCVIRDHRGRIGLVQMELISKQQEELAKNPRVAAALRVVEAA